MDNNRIQIEFNIQNKKKVLCIGRISSLHTSYDQLFCNCGSMGNGRPIYSVWMFPLNVLSKYVPQDFTCALYLFPVPHKVCNHSHEWCWLASNDGSWEEPAALLKSNCRQNLASDLAAASKSYSFINMSGLLYTTVLLSSNSTYVWFVIKCILLHTRQSVIVCISPWGKNRKTLSWLIP